jgi:N-acetylneuraminic acid mutarotase
MKLQKHFFLCFVLFFVFTAWADAKWRFVCPMPNGRYGHDAALGPDGKIYVMGGFAWYFHSGRYSNIAYDPQKDSWTVLMPVPGWVFVEEDLIMLFDPEKGTWDWVKKVSGEKDCYKVFDRDTETYKLEKRVVSLEWIRNTNLQRKGDGVAIVTGKDGRIYWLGGQGKWVGFGEDIVLPYDPVSGRWPEVTTERIYYSSCSYGDKTIYQTDMPPMKERRMDHEAAVTSDGRIFVMGGRQFEQHEDSYGNVKGGPQHVLDTVECYDPRTNTWEYRKPMTIKRFLFAAVTGPDDRIYTFGGSGEFVPNKSRKTFDATEVYDPKTDTWSCRSSMPEPRYSHAGVLGADGRIYILGGSKGEREPPVKNVFIYDPAEDRWSGGPCMNIHRSTLAAVATPDGKIYAIGGTDVGAYKKQENLNIFLPQEKHLYTGKVQETVEVLDIFKLGK